MRRAQQELRFYPWQMLSHADTVLAAARAGTEAVARLGRLCPGHCPELYNHPFAFFVLGSEGCNPVVLAETCLRAEEGDAAPQASRAAYLRQLVARAAMAVALVAFLPMLSLSLSFTNTQWCSAERAQHLPLGWDRVVAVVACRVRTYGCWQTI